MATDVAAAKLEEGGTKFMRLIVSRARRMVTQPDVLLISINHITYFNIVHLVYQQLAQATIAIRTSRRSIKAVMTSAAAARLKMIFNFLFLVLI